jgi:hypothetical protein
MTTQKAWRLDWAPSMTRSMTKTPTRTKLHGATWSLEGESGSGVLTRVEAGSAVALGVEEGTTVKKVGDLVLLLHMQGEAIRNQCGHLVGDERHGGEELTDDGVTWGERSARTRRLAGRKESMIGEVMRRLVGGE